MVSGAEGGHVRQSPQGFVLAPPSGLKVQGRFGHLTADEVRPIQEAVDRKWAKLLEEDGEAAARAKAAKAAPAP